MRQNSLDETALKTALLRDLVIEAVLERIAAQTLPVSEIDAEIYYHQYPEAFTRPEITPRKKKRLCLAGSASAHAGILGYTQHLLLLSSFYDKNIS
ncbi:MAG: hypothetical protein LBT71_00265 [Azoarcus sp.]|jgi:hypothetical protein|nr:hypothetical protein [Azoarcus sp.]